MRTRIGAVAALVVVWMVGSPVPADADDHDKASGRCTIVGTPGPDVLRGTRHADFICGLGGDDKISGRGGDDVIQGGGGDDLLIGGPGNDVIGGGRGDDTLNGLDDNTAVDKLRCGRGDDTAKADPPDIPRPRCEHVEQNDAPTNISLSPGSVPENAPGGTSAGTLAASDADAGDTHTFTLVPGTGSADNGSFTIVGSTLRTAVALDHETTPTQSVRVRATDAGGLSVEKALTVTVTDVDDPPVAVGDTKTVTEDDAATAVDVLANDTDVDGGPKTVQSVTQPAHGTVAIQAGGTGVTYAPASNYCNTPAPPTDDFTYTLNGGSTATVKVTVTCVDDPAVANDDSKTVPEDSGATVIDVLANDTDVEGDPFSVTAVTQPSHGSASFTAANVSYTPNANYCNNPPPFDTFTYTITGGDTATVSVTVTCVNDAPVAVDDTKTTTEDTPITFPASDLTANDTDVDNDPLTVTAVSGSVGGTANLSAGSITFTPAANLCNPSSAGFDYTVSDGTATDTGHVDVTVTCVNDPPVANDDTKTVAEDASATVIDVLANDTDVENDAINVTGVGAAANGTTSFTAADVSYTPDPDFCGSDSFTYTVNGGDAATVSVTVTCVNDAPVLDLDTTAGGAGSSATFHETNPHTGTGVLIAPNAAVTDVDDSNLEGATITLTNRPDGGAESLSFTSPGGSGITGTYAPATGVLALTGTATKADYAAAIASVRYDNTTNPPNAADRTITVTVNDGDTDSNSATATVQVVPLNVKPDLDLDTGTAGNDATASFTEDGPAVVVAPNPVITDTDDTDMEGATVVLTSRPDGNGNESLTFTIPGGSGITAPGGYDSGTGTITFTGTSSKANYATLLGSVKYANASDTPTTTARSVTFTVNDGNDDSVLRTSTVSLTATDDPPVNTVPGAQSATEDTAKAITGISVADPDDASLTVTLSVTDGTLTLASTAGLAFTTGDGTADASMKFSGAKAAINAALATVTYDPAANFNGAATLTLKTEDATLSDTDTVTINVAAVNDAPVNSVPGPQTVDEDTNLFFTGGNALSVTDPDNEPLTVGVQVTHGTFTLSGTAGLTVTGDGTNDVTLSGPIAALNSALNNSRYRPAADYFGPAQLTLASADVGGLFDLDQVAITVNPVNDAPTDAGESQNATGNTRLEVELPSGGSTNPTRVSATGNLLDNATDVDDPANTLTVDTTTVTDPPHGTVTVNADGSYIYTPDAGYTGADSFDYKVTDTHGAQSAAHTVSITVGTLVWYVRADAAAGGDGRSETPFNSLGGAETASASGSTIYVFRKAGDAGTAGDSDNAVQLDGNQVLLGSGVDLVDGAATLYDGTAALTPKVGAAVLLGSGDTVRAMTVDAGANGPSIQGGAGDNAGTLDQLTVNGSTGGLNLNATSGAWNLSALTISTTGGAAVNLNSAGTVNFAAAGTISLSSTSGPALTAAGTALSGTVDSTTTFSSPTTGVSLTTTTGSLTLDDVNLVTTGTALTLNNANDVTVNNSGDADVTSSGRAIDLTNGPTTQPGAPDVALDQVSSSGGTVGINIDGIGAGTFSAAGGTLSGHSAAEIDVNGGSGNITYPGTLGNGSGLSVQITGRSGGTVALSGNIADGPDAGGGIDMSSNSGGTFTFSGATKTLNTGSGAAFASTGSGPAINLTGGGLDIDTTSGNGLSATGGGTIVVGTGGSPNTIDSTTGTALNVTGTTIGAGGLTFRSISANGATNGVVLNNTGSTAGLTITGNGAACTSAGTCTGGAILNTTSAVSLTSTRDVSIDRMFIQNTVGDGIDGTTTTNFSFTNGRIDNSGTGLGAETSNIGFNTTAAGTENNLSGVVTITGNTLTNAYYHGIDIFNFNGTISNAAISNNTITSTTSTATSKGAGIRLVGFGSAGTVANITTATLNANTVSNFPSGSGIQVQGGNANMGGGNPAGSYGSAGSPIAVTNNIISGQNAANRMGTQGIVANVNGKGTAFYNVATNTVSNTFGTSISIGSFGIATSTVTVAGNTITANNAVGSQGIGAGTGAVTTFTETPTLNIAVTGNTISQTDGNGILLVARDAAGHLNAGVRNNNVAAPLGGLRPGIRLDAGNTNSTDDAVCLDISGNTSAGTGGATQGIGLRKQGTVATTNDFGIEGMAATSSPGVESFVDGQNPAGNGTLLISASSGFSSCNTAP